MLNYAVCEIAGKQYKILPNVPFKTSSAQQKDIEVNVLLLVEDGKIKIGKPFLKEKLSLKFVDSLDGKKIRVSKYKNKANYRRVLGHRAKFSQFVLNVKKGA